MQFQSVQLQENELSHELSSFPNLPDVSCSFVKKSEEFSFAKKRLIFHCLLNKLKFTFCSRVSDKNWCFSA